MDEENIKSRDHILNVFFQKISPQSILDKKICSYDFPRQVFSEQCRSEMTYLSDTEISNIYDYLAQQSIAHKVDVFALLGQVADELLYVRGDKPVCKYEHILRWRNLVRFLGEDLPVCAYLAVRTRQNGDIWDGFAWETVISHDNIQLNSLMQRGVSDNHFHLFGSAPAFHLIWLKLMNEPANRQCQKAINELGKKRRVGNVVFTEGQRNTELTVLCYQAACIRQYLFEYLYRKRNHMPCEELNKKLCELLLFAKAGSLSLGLTELHTEIHKLRLMADMEGPQNQMDYALQGLSGDGLNHAFEGERALLYRMLLGSVDGERIPDVCMNLFYAYLVIKGRFYRELVQVNETIGFHNFSIYNSRKNGFITSMEENKRMVRHAVWECFDGCNMQSLELRITPQKTVRDMRETILSYDQWIKNPLNEEDDKTGKSYYVLHFPKKPDEALKEGIGGMQPVCRHQSYRDSLNQQGEVLVRFRMQAQAHAERVRGIDACSQEIGCRPEVFGPVFRRLSGHVVPRSVNIYNVRQWKITFHVGEDFLDMVDGLRAIDEAILFLNMKRGDRFGHATVLGLHVRKWYAGKKETVSLPLQDYLDNVVWLYHKLIEFKIPDCEVLKSYLQEQYNEVFYELYGNVLDQNFVNDVSEKVRQKKASLGWNTYGCKEDFTTFDIGTYYAAWKLRGDDPTVYHNDYYVDTSDMTYGSRINRKLEEGKEIRGRAKAVALFLYYHYSVEVRKRGAEKKSYTLPDFYVEGVEKVQQAMQWMVAERGICIESNPSSNNLISAMESYRDHPISSFYNMGLTVKSKELHSCPQLHVSVNTDDKGVFHTSLPNEFALLGSAMESIRDKSGQRIHSGQMVYEWLDRIREMGNQQSFLDER